MEICWSGPTANLLYEISEYRTVLLLFIMICTIAHRYPFFFPRFARSNGNHGRCERAKKFPSLRGPNKAELSTP
jgi:hypothetical protein